MGYQSKFKGVSKFRKGKLSAVWQYVCHYVIRCLSRRTRGTHSIGKPLFDIVWSNFIRNPVNYGHILWEDFLQYVSKGTPKEGMTELTYARFLSLYLVDLHKNANLILGNDTNLFSTRDLKRYIPSKYKSIFGPTRCLPSHILQTIGITTLSVVDHTVDTSSSSPYRSTPPNPPSQ